MSLLLNLLILVNYIYGDHIYNYCKDYIILYDTTISPTIETNSPNVITDTPTIESFSPTIETKFYYDENEKRSDMATRYWLYVYNREEYNRIYN